MKARSKLLLLLLLPAVSLLFGCLPAPAMWAFYQTQTVPIGRVLTNLETRVKQNTNDLEAVYYLARLHSMAYSTNLVTVEIRTNGAATRQQWPMFNSPGSDTGVPESVTKPATPMQKQAADLHLAKAIEYYRRAVLLFPKGSNATAHPWLKVPVQIGLAWSLDQAGQQDEALKAYRRALQLAWHQEVDQTISLSEQFRWSWDQLRARQSPLSKPPHGLGPGVCYSEEVIGYLLKLLDPAKDKQEIAQLKKDRQTLQGMSRAITPILVPLAANLPFSSLVNPEATVSFDLDGSGFPRHWGWITPQAAWLVYDHDGKGNITSGLQLFGSVTFWVFWRDGYAALSSLDDNGDGQLTGDELRGLALWQDLNSNGRCDPGEIRSLADHGITAINTHGSHLAPGIEFQLRGVTLKNGESRPTYDWTVPANEKVLFRP